MLKFKKFLFRILFLFLILAPLLYFNHFYDHFYVYITGNIIREVITQQWHIIAINIMLFMAFMIPLSYRRKADWKEYGLVSAFFISLFIEMYGIPLTILFISNYFSNANSNLPNSLIGFNVLGVNLGMDIGMTYGAFLIIVGMCLIITGWITLYKNVKKKGLVINGIYSYSRHPQYLGFILITIGWFIAWPTILTLIFVPILIYKYIRVCKKEENEISTTFSGYKKYREKVPFLF